MPSSKRDLGVASSSPSENLAVAKRAKTDQLPAIATAALVKHADTGALVRSIKRVSNLAAPIMLLTGHESDVLSCSFSPDGRSLASASADRSILLWKAHATPENYRTLKGHTGAVLQVQWSRDGSRVFSTSSDASVAVWDVESGERIRRFRGHTAVVNSCSASRRGPEFLVSASDDGKIQVWDLRQKQAVKTLVETFPQTAVAFSIDGGIVFSGGINNSIKAWDLRQDCSIYSLSDHTDTITGLRLSPDGDMLLSNAMDNTVRIWDVKPFTIRPTRQIKVLQGAVHGFEKNLIRPCWSPDSQFVATGGGDRTVVVWDVDSENVVYKLPGHKGCVNEVDWAGSVIASASADKTIYLGELNTSEVK